MTYLPKFEKLLLPFHMLSLTFHKSVNIGPFWVLIINTPTSDYFILQLQTSHLHRTLSHIAILQLIILVRLLYIM